MNGKQKAIDRAVNWYGVTQATLLELKVQALKLAIEVEREGSPLYGMFDADGLRDFAGGVVDHAISYLQSNSPRIELSPGPCAAPNWMVTASPG